MAMKVPPTGMSIEEQIRMLDRCRGEIKMLQNLVDSLQPKAEAYDALRQLLSMIPNGTSGVMREDLAWSLDKRLDALQREFAPHKASQVLGIETEEE